MPKKDINRKLITTIGLRFLMENVHSFLFVPKNGYNRQQSCEGDDQSNNVERLLTKYTISNIEHMI
ncbi:hypothetical protein BBR01nite_12170 [Brevibacillus brevis]|nr:hypothetical protein BBR01nite_12170 [Brevibacillus brevis]